MHIKLLSTFKKNYYEVIDEEEKMQLITSKGDITATSKILEKENDLENLNNYYHFYCERLREINEYYKTKCKFDKIVPTLLLLIIILLKFFPLNFFLMFIGSIAIAGEFVCSGIYFYAIINSAPTKKKYLAKKEIITELMNETIQKMTTVKENINTLKEENEYHKIADLNNNYVIDKENLNFEEEEEVIQVLKLTKNK